MIDEIDRLIANIAEKQKQRDAAVATCRQELDAGRTGLAAYEQAVALDRDISALAKQAGEKIEDALKRIGA